VVCGLQHHHLAAGDVHVIIREQLAWWTNRAADVSDDVSAGPSNTMMQEQVNGCASARVDTLLEPRCQMLHPFSPVPLQLVCTATNLYNLTARHINSTLTYVSARCVTLAPLKHSHFDSFPCYTVRAACLHCHVFSLCTTCLHHLAFDALWITTCRQRLALSNGSTPH
jgi:hypothetical protein